MKYNKVNIENKSRPCNCTLFIVVSSEMNTITCWKVVKLDRQYSDGYQLIYKEVLLVLVNGEIFCICDFGEAWMKHIAPNNVKS